MLFKRRAKVGGEIALYSLEKWWLGSFSSEEREYITSLYQPMNEPRRRILTEGDLSDQKDSPYLDQNRESLLSALPGWLRKPQDRPLQRKLIEESMPLARSVSAKHFLLIQLIESVYRDRDRDPNALMRVIRLCEQDIAIADAFQKDCRRRWPSDALPRHPGFEKLAIIREKQGELQAALKISRQARKQGWSGDWEKRITRLHQKADRKS